MALILDEMEIELAANKLVRFAEYLGRCMDQYMSIISEAETKGYLSEGFTNRLSHYRTAMIIPKLEVNRVSDTLSGATKSFIDEVEAIDYFEKEFTAHGRTINF